MGNPHEGMGSDAGPVRFSRRFRNALRGGNAAGKIPASPRYVEDGLRNQENIQPVGLGCASFRCRYCNPLTQRTTNHTSQKISTR